MNRKSVLGVCAGLAVSVGVNAQVVNGDFETGDFTGWTQFGDTTYDGVWDGEPHGGVFSAYFGAIGTPSGISQTLSGVNAGDRVTVRFWLVNEDGSTPNTCLVTLDGQTVLSLTDFTDTAYEEFSATITVGATNPDLVFAFTNDLAFTDLDDVTVTVEAGSTCYPNCDASTQAPVLNVLDFGCFLNRFAAGCS